MKTSNPLPNGEYGFVFHSPKSPQLNGVSRLEIVLRDNPTGRFFESESVELTTREGEKQIKKQIFTHPWPWKNEYWVCPGRVRLIDRKGERVDAFTFGGKFNVHTQDQRTIAVLKSNAPIVNLLAKNDRSILLAAEVEILLAKQRAEALPELNAYELWLADLDPLEFYTACLLALRDKFNNYPEENLHHYRDFYIFLDTRINQLKRNQLWQGSIPDFTFPLIINADNQ